MVGVPGRSRACDNCRRRRIKCDLHEPACQRCITADLKCGGKRDITFVHHDGRKPGAKVDHSVRAFGQRAVTPAGARPSTSPAHPLQSLSGPTVSIPQDDIFVNYYRARLLQGPDANEIMAPPEIDRSLGDLTMLALATTFFGAEHRDSALIQRGLRRHNSALKRVNDALGDAEQSKSFDILEAVVTMALFEYLISERDRGWVRHARGFETLIEFRGVEAFKSLPELMIFERTRASMIFAALILQQPTIIARSEWKSVPWTLYPSRKTPMQFLLDIFADCTTLRVARKELEMGDLEDSYIQKHHAVVTDTQELLRELDRFEESWRYTYRDCVWEVPSAATTPTTINPEGSQIPLWPTSLVFPSLDHANVVALGGAIRIFLWMLYQDLPSTGSMATQEKMSRQLTMAGFTICRTIDYQLQEISKGASNHLLFYPARMAFEAVGHNNPSIGVWLMEILSRISEGLAGRWNMAAQNLHTFLTDRTR